jgi:hypothetical protein
LNNVKSSSWNIVVTVKFYSLISTLKKDLMFSQVFIQEMWHFIYLITKKERSNKDIQIVNYNTDAKIPNNTLGFHTSSVCLYFSTPGGGLCITTVERGKIPGVFPQRWSSVSLVGVCRQRLMTRTWLESPLFKVSQRIHLKHDNCRAEC